MGDVMNCVAVVSVLSLSSVCFLFASLIWVAILIAIVVHWSLDLYFKYAHPFHPTTLQYLPFQILNIWSQSMSFLISMWFIHNPLQARPHASHHVDRPFPRP